MRLSPFVDDVLIDQINDETDHLEKKSHCREIMYLEFSQFSDWDKDVLTSSL